MLNNDYRKKTYDDIDPDTVDDTKRPYYLWAIATAIYEFSLTAALGVTLVFCCVEFPYMVVEGFFDNEPWYMIAIAWGMHTFPQLFMLLEWMYSSIPISWLRVPLYICVSLCYTLVNVTIGEKGKPVYMSANWLDRTSDSTLIITLTSVGYMISVTIAYFITKKKLEG